MAPGQDFQLSAPLANLDLRSASMQSLHSPAVTTSQEKRKLLLIYVHGFLGDETSFKQFPAHVHHCLTEALKERVIHTKVYPKYKTREKIEQVREIFSQWLAPHEASDQDVVLLGHSMGGILAAEVALLPSYGIGNIGNLPRLRHRILGTLNLDVPFLGLHPGIVGSGIGSLFSSAPKPERSPSPARLSSTPSTGSVPNEHESTANLHLTDSNGKPSSRNESLSPSLSPSISASASQSSISLSVPVNDPNYDPKFSNDVVLKKRKGRSNFWHFINKHSNDLLHAAETWVTSHAEFGGAMADYRALRRRYDSIRELEDRRDGSRVRFVNYYTVCYGKPKIQKGSAAKNQETSTDTELDRGTSEVLAIDQEQQGSGDTKSIDESTTFQGLNVEASSATLGQSLYPPELHSDQRLEQLASSVKRSDTAPGRAETRQSEGGPGCTSIEDPAEGQRSFEPGSLEGKATEAVGEPPSKDAKPKKEKKFCSLPRKREGARDPCWVEVFMPDVDEVGAHCGLFSMEEDPDRYELFVQDVSMRIVDWIHESCP